MSSKKSLRNLLSVSLSKGAPGAGSGASKMGSWVPSTESITAGVSPGKRHMTCTLYKRWRGGHLTSEGHLEGIRVGLRRTHPAGRLPHGEHGCALRVLVETVCERRL